MSIRRRALFSAIILLLHLGLTGFGDQWVPPPFPDDLPPFPDDPPDVWDVPFDPNDLPDPIDIPLPPPEDPWDDPLPDFPIPDPPAIEDPFPDLPSFLTDPFDDIPDIPLPPPDFPGLAQAVPGRPQSIVPTLGVQAPAGVLAQALSSAATNAFNRLMPYPKANLPLSPVLPAQPASAGLSPCNPSVASHMMFAENKRTTVAFANLCPFTITQRVDVGGKPISIRLGPDHRTAFVSVIDKGYVAVIDLNTMTVSRKIALPADQNGVPAQPTGIAILPDGSRAYVISHVDDPGSAVYVIDLQSFTVMATVPVSGFPAGIRALPDGAQVWVTSRAQGNVTVIDTTTNKAVTQIRNIPLTTGLDFNPTGTRAYVAAGIDTGPGYIAVIDTSNYNIIKTIPVEILPHAVAVSPTGKDILVTNALSNSISQINAASGIVVRTVHLKAKHPLGLAFVRMR